jgi:hypothetical protein
MNAEKVWGARYLPENTVHYYLVTPSVYGAGYVCVSVNRCFMIIEDLKQ